jgi:hypothetical protein
MFENLKTLPTAGLKRIGQASTTAVLDPAKGLDGEQTFRQKFERRSIIHALHIANAAKALERLPDEDEVIHVLMAGNFHGWDFVGAILSLAKPATITELYVATLGFSDANSGELLELLDRGKIGRVWFNCSCYMRDASAHLFQPLTDALTKRGQLMRATRNHAKLLCAKLTDGRHIVVDGSMNLRSCRNVEQANIWQSRELFDFYAGYVRDNCEREAHVR